VNFKYIPQKLGVDRQIKEVRCFMYLGVETKLVVSVGKAEEPASGAIRSCPSAKELN
jgi:hypothetical protein